MARLFITPREIDFIADINKELAKDIIGQQIYYYKVREDVTEVHDVYEEAIDKVFDPPILIDALIEWSPATIKTNRFGYEKTYELGVYIHYRDMVDKGISLSEGDYLSYGDNFFEITSITYDKTVFGQIEHLSGYVVKAKQARKGQIDEKPHGPTEEIYTDPDAVQETWTQQRGQVKNQEGLTGDKRALQDNGTLDSPITGPKQVKKTDGINSNFYGDE